jgi:hypothetical protein
LCLRKQLKDNELSKVSYDDVENKQNRLEKLIKKLKKKNDEYVRCIEEYELKLVEAKNTIQELLTLTQSND